MTESERSPFRPVDYAFGFQGLFLVGNGFYTLFFPTQASAPPSPFVGTPVGVVQIISMTSFSIGVSYLLAVHQRNRAQMLWAVPGRVLAVLVLSRHGGEFSKIAIFEGAMGFLTAGCLLWDRFSGQEKMKEV